MEERIKELERRVDLLFMICNNTIKVNDRTIEQLEHIVTVLDTQSKAIKILSEKE